MQKFLSIPVVGGTNQLVAVNGIVLIEEAVPNTVTIHYANPAAAQDVVTLTCTGSTGTAARDLIQTAVVEALQTAWTKPSYEVNLGSTITVTGIAIA
jgi:hypothetical protein